MKRFGAIADWHSAIAESRIDGDVPDGMPGCVRVLRLADGGTLRERLLAFDDANRSLTYRFDAAQLPVDDYHLTVALAPITGETRLPRHEGARAAATARRRTPRGTTSRRPGRRRPPQPPLMLRRVGDRLRQW